MRPLVIANWKCNPATLKGAKLLFSSVKKGIENVKNVEVVICPPFIYLPKLFEFLSRWRKSQILLGAQDCFWEESGAYTGEISPTMLKDLGCQYVIIGHSERRALGETDKMINKKLKAALKEKLKPILCIGETIEERERGKTNEILKNQLNSALKNTSSVLSHRLLVIAYEPVWAIGTGRACDVRKAKEARLFIKKILREIPILYGGSVDSENGVNYIKEADFQGLLVGGASLNPKEFSETVKTIDLISK